ncbi:MAG: thymidylate kinase [Clostridia bacterium]
MNKIFVIEGTDGCGKQTQTELIYKRLLSEKKNVFKTSFPNYSSPSSGPVKEYLSGNISSDSNKISPKAASTFYAVDRYISYKENIETYFKDKSTIILFDRYVSSNLLHQGGKLLSTSNDFSKLDDFSNWIERLEFEDLELPRPTCVFFLHLPLELSLQLMKKRNNKFTGDEKKDIHESDPKHLKNAINSGMYLAKKLNWYIIECSKDGNIRTIEDINDEIYSIINKNL